LKVPAIPHSDSPTSFDHRHLSASRLSDTRGSLKKEDEEVTKGSPVNGVVERNDELRGLSGIKALAAKQWGPRFNPAWRVAFGNSNERGSGEDEAVQGSSPEPRENVPVASRPSSPTGSEDIKEESMASHGDHTHNGLADGDMKPKRKARISAARRVKGEGELDNGPPTMKRRRGI